MAAADPTTQEILVNDDMNLAAWMIAGGRTRTTFDDDRRRAHLRALAAKPTGRRLADRVATFLEARRPAPALAGIASSTGLDGACCAA